MAWADLENDKVVTDINLDGAVAESILNKKDGSFPQENRALTKQLALERYDLKTAPLASTDNDQLVIKSKIQGCFRAKWFNNTANSVSLYGATIYVGGNFTLYGDTYPCNRIVRLFTTGQVDTSFNIGTGFNGEVKFVKHLGATYGNTVLVGGSFTAYNGQSVGKIVVLNSNGALARTNLSITNEPSDCYVRDAGGGLLYVTFSDNSHFMKRYNYDATLSEDTSFTISSYLVGQSARSVSAHIDGGNTQLLVSGNFGFFFAGRSYTGFAKIDIINGQFFPDWFVSNDGVNPVNCDGYGAYTFDTGQLLLHGVLSTSRGIEGIVRTNLQGQITPFAGEVDISHLQIPNARNPYLDVKVARTFDVAGLSRKVFLVCSELSLHTFDDYLGVKYTVASSFDSPRAFKKAQVVVTGESTYVVGEFPSLIGYNNKRIVKLKNSSTTLGLEVDTDCV